jgi:hypothetical protein
MDGQRYKYLKDHLYFTQHITLMIHYYSSKNSIEKHRSFSHDFYNYTKFLVVHKAQVQLSMHDTIISFIMSLF